MTLRSLNELRKVLIDITVEDELSTTTLTLRVLVFQIFTVVKTLRGFMIQVGIGVWTHQISLVYNWVDS